MVDSARSITREPRFAQSIERWKAFWALEDIGRPLWLVPTSPAQTSALLGMCKLPDLVMDKEVQLKAELDLLQWRESFGVEDDFVPHLQPQGGTSVFASAFGCEVQYFDHTLPWAHPVIREHDPAGESLRPSTSEGDRRTARPDAGVQRLLRRADRRPLPDSPDRPPGAARHRLSGLGLQRLHAGDVHQPQGSPSPDAPGDGPDHRLCEGAACPLTGVHPLPLPAGLPSRRSWESH